MQKFFTDKTKLFECQISVDGANLNETKARLILEFPNKRNLLFHGDIDSNGKCKVIIPALKEMSECEGNVLLEVIADSTHFESWRDKFQLETNKRVQVEMVENQKEVIVENSKPRVEVFIESSEDIERKTIFENFNKYVSDKKINLNVVTKNKQAFFNMLFEYKKSNNLTKENVIQVVEELQRVVKTNQIQNLLKS